jgi:hypothetical protein
LAGESCRDDIRFASDKASRRNVLVDFNARPSFGKYPLAISVDLTERDGSHSGSFEPEAESADAGKEVEDIHYSFFS